METHTILIDFHDNDYIRTFVPLLKSIMVLLEEFPELTKEQIQVAVIDGIEYHYKHFQGLPNIRRGSIVPIEHSVKYLKKIGVKVYLNEEVVHYLKDGCFLNSNTVSVCLYDGKVEVH